jgi:hypothetical protein
MKIFSKTYGFNVSQYFSFLFLREKNPPLSLLVLEIPSGTLTVSKYFHWGTERMLLFRLQFKTLQIITVSWTDHDS